MADEARSWFRNNRWWITPLFSLLAFGIPWLINYGEQREDQREWRARVNYRLTCDSTNAIIIFDTLDKHMDKFNDIEPSCYKK